MAFRYINPGYAAVLNPEDAYITVEDFTYNPKNGVAIKYNNSSAHITLDYIPTELYGSFNVVFTEKTYFHSGNYGIMFKTNNNQNISGLEFYNNTGYDNYVAMRMRYNDSVISNYPSFSNYSSGTIVRRCWFHIRMKISENDEVGLTEVSIDGGKTIYRQEFSTVATFYSNNMYIGIREGVYLSNLILSDEYISPREQVVALPITATDTDMTAGANGLYIADAANQSLLQSVDAATLGAIHGANSPVTGVALVGNPAYKTAEGLASFTSLSKAGGIVTEHDSFSLSDDTESVIQSSWALSNMTIADLQNMQFGWKAGA